MVIRIEILCPSWPWAFYTVLHFSIFSCIYVALCVVKVAVIILESAGRSTCMRLTPWSEILLGLVSSYWLVNSRHLGLLKFIKISYFLWNWLIKNLVRSLHKYSSRLKNLVLVPHAKLNHLLDTLLRQAWSMLIKRMTVFHHYLAYISKANIPLSLHVVSTHSIRVNTLTIGWERVVSLRRTIAGKLRILNWSFVLYR
jgi:hypothetical protein